MTVLELRILFVLGLIVTAVLAYATVAGSVALIRWLGGLNTRLIALRRSGVERPAERAALGRVMGEAEGSVRSWQAAWRLRC
jgi:hypothetical protein